MTEDSKPGLRLGPTIKQVVHNAKLQGAEVDDAVASSLYADAGIGRLARFERDEPVFDESGLSSTDPDGFDDGSAF